jgi:hypothetical protein
MLWVMVRAYSKIILPQNFHLRLCHSTYKWLPSWTRCLSCSECIYGTLVLASASIHWRLVDSAGRVR